jgi:hypothetical protein
LISETKIKAFAEGQSCTARIPGVCNNRDDTSVWCHLPSVRWGSGKALKVHALIGLIGCHACHDAIDGRIKKTRDGEPLDPEFVRLCAYEGHFESLYRLDQAGII